mmetsp:Transcript_133703/g.198760  ORF Transcript_133703/g.198760 Transcript_133703/m.198760 type:complete len:266 (-) Transcript_133703:1140-1937(-)
MPSVKTHTRRPMLSLRRWTTIPCCPRRPSRPKTNGMWTPSRTSRFQNVTMFLEWMPSSLRMNGAFLTKKHSSRTRSFPSRSRTSRSIRAAVKVLTSIWARNASSFPRRLLWVIATGASGARVSLCTSPCTSSPSPRCLPLPAGQMRKARSTSLPCTPKATWQRSPTFNSVSAAALRLEMRALLPSCSLISHSSKCTLFLSTRMDLSSGIPHSSTWTRITPRLPRRTISPLVIRASRTARVTTLPTTPSMASKGHTLERMVMWCSM